MPYEIIINATSFETRMAFLSQGKVFKYLIERKAERDLVGNIFKGKVVKVLPGMQACFVEIGLEKAAFLYVDDIASSPFFDPDSEDETEAEESSNYKKNLKISDLIKEGEELLVQVIKNPVGTKGARVTTHVSLAGRFLVYMPTVNHVGVSKKIENIKERDRLRSIISELRTKPTGFIARTFAEGVSKGAIKNDMQFLEKLWKNIKNISVHAAVGKVIYQELDLILKTIRDYFSQEVSRLIIDNKEEHKKILKFTQAFSPKLKRNIELYTGKESIFDSFSLEAVLGRALNRKIWLKSGGYIVIDQTEALTAIDVNSGRYVGKRNLEDTILKINLEAVQEISDQMQIRNIGGLIIIDFIDMEKENNREEVFNALREAFKNDKAKTNVLKISELGLVQMTRQRTASCIRDIVGNQCPYCDGRGFVKSAESMAYEILRNIEKEISEVKKGDSLVALVNPEVAKYVVEKIHSIIENYEKKHKIRIYVEPKEAYHVEQFELIQKKNG